MVSSSSYKQCFLAFLLVNIAVVLVMVWFEINRLSTDSVNFYPRIMETPSHRKITVSFWGRTGNHMFEYAALIGLASRYNMTPVIIEKTSLVNIFDIPVQVISREHMGTYKIMNEKLAGGYNVDVEKIYDLDMNVYLEGYLQSWVYFDNVRSDLKNNHFIFKKHILKEAHAFLHKAKTNLKKSKDVIFIGVHVRRGDFVNARRRGYGAAPLPYFYRAMNYYVRRYAEVIFIVCSNGMRWCKENFDSDYYPIQYSDLSSSDLDLAVLSQCNHSIVSVGSFSWWSGYLAGGEVLYPLNAFPIPNTTIGESYVRAEYFPLSWKGL